MSGTFTNHIIFTRRYRMYYPYRYKSDYYFTSRYRYRYTLSRLCMFTELRKTAYRTTHRTQQRHIETSLPVTEYDTSFQTLINTRQRAIDDIVLEALHQRGY